MPCSSANSSSSTVFAGLSKTSRSGVKPAGEGLLQLAGRGDFAAHAGVGEQPEYRYQSARLGREGVLDRGRSLERLVQCVHRGQHPVDVEEADQRRAGAEQAVLDGTGQRRLAGGLAPMGRTGCHLNQLLRDGVMA